MTFPRKTILYIGLAAALWLAFSLGSYSAWVHGADHRDFYPWWAGARLAIFEGRDLYSVDTVRDMQVTLYGAPLPADRDQQGFAYPAQMLVVLFPFWFISDKEIATAVWQGLSVLLLAGSLMLLNRTRPHPAPAWVLALLILWQYPLLMLFQGQITALLLAGLAVGWWAYHNRRDGLAGAALAVGVLKPELALLPWLFFLLKSLRERRWKLTAWFAAVQVILFALSLVLAGWWLPGWLSALQRYTAYAKPNWVPLTAWQISPWLLLALLLLVGILLWLIRWSPAAAFAASIPLGMLALPQTLLWGLTLLLAPLTLAWARQARWLVVAAWLFGWAFLAAPVGWWRMQTLALPLLALAAVTWRSRLVKNKA